MPVEIIINSPPISVPSRHLRFGTISVGSGPVRRKVPLTNQAAHPVSINFYIMTKHDYYIFCESGQLPYPLDDEDYPIENSPFDQFIHAIGHHKGIFYKIEQIRHFIGLLYHKFGNMVIFRTANLYSLCSPANQHYQKIIYFFIFSSKKVEIGYQSSIIKYISLMI